MTKRIMMSTRALLLLVLLALAGAACTLQPADAITLEAATPTAVFDVSPERVCVEKGYSWIPGDQSCQHIETGNPSITIHYPIELAGYPVAAAAIDPYLSTRLAQFKQQFGENREPTPGQWSLDLRYTIFQHSISIISVRFDDSFYSGGAHPGLTQTSFTFDVAQPGVITFADLFASGVDPLTALAPRVRAQLATQMGAVDDSMTQWIADGTDTLDDFRNFALSATALILTFETYQVAPGASGPQVVEIPLSEIGSLLKPQFQ